MIVAQLKLGDTSSAVVLNMVPMGAMAPAGAFVHSPSAQQGREAMALRLLGTENSGAVGAGVLCPWQVQGPPSAQLGREVRAPCLLGTECYGRQCSLSSWLLSALPRTAAKNKNCSPSAEWTECLIFILLKRLNFSYR